MFSLIWSRAVIGTGKAFARPLERLRTATDIWAGAVRQKKNGRNILPLTLKEDNHMNTANAQTQTNGSEQSSTTPVDRMEQASSSMASDLSGMRAEFARQNSPQALAAKAAVGLVLVTAGI